MIPLFQYGDLGAANLGTGAIGAIIGVMMAFLLVFLILAVVAYIYMSLALMKIAQRTKTEPAWLAWIPIGNLYLMSKIAKMHWWPMLLLFGGLIPFVGFIASIAFVVFMYIWMWKICEARGKPGWWALLTLIPVFGIIWYVIMFGILAWGKE